MSELAILVDNVSKVFRIYDRPGDRLREAFSLKREKFHTDFHALRNVHFEVEKGEFLGIVGRNGAGKSTLLKILSRELTPTSGSVTTNGKISLLQLGVGFDPELTGIDNARFASKLQGYADHEVEGMMEDIIAFADIGEFIRHPVKTYSSGMYSRLAFAVGININPDILIADEVLSVGDMRFSQKCLRKMREFKERGKTVIFVSHDIQSVNAFCDTGMWVKDGEIYMRGECRQVTTSFLNYMLYDKLPNEYHAMAVPESATLASAGSPTLPEQRLAAALEGTEWTDLTTLPCVGDGRVEISRMALLSAKTLANVRHLDGNEEVILLLDIHAKARIEAPQVGIVVYNQQGLPALHTNNEICGSPIHLLAEGEQFVAAFRFKLPSLSSGSYTFSVGVQAGAQMPQKIDYAYEFRVSRSDAKRQQCGYVIVEEESFSMLPRPQQR